MTHDQAPTTAPTTAPRTAPRRLATLVTAVLSAVALAACGGGGTDSPPAEQAAPGASPSAAARTPLRIAFVPATTALPLHVAKAQGLFDAQGLDVTLTKAANISDLPSTLGRQFDLAMGTATDLLRAGSAGLDVVQVAGNTVSTKDNPFVRVVAPARAGIRDFGDLEGKTVGSPTLSGVIHVGTLYTAKQQGADPAKIRGVEAPSPVLPDQLEAGRVDAVEALEPFATSLTRAGNVAVGDPFSAIADPLATNFFVAQGAWARANADVVRRFVEAMQQAVRYVEQQPQQARAVLSEFTEMPPPVAATVPLPTYDLDVRAEDLDRWADVLRELGQLDREVDTGRLVLTGQ